MKASTTARELVKKGVLYQFIALLIALVFFVYGEEKHFLQTLWTSLIFTNCISFIIEGLYFLFPTLQPNVPVEFSFTLIGRHFLITFAGMFLGTEIALWLIKILLQVTYFSIFSVSHLLLQVMNALISLVLIVIMAAFYRLRSRLELKNREYRELESLQTRTRLAVLQARINPHFLFNTLNTILDLIYKSPQKAETVVLNLSDIYREVLSQTANEWNTLGKELDLVRKYLEIEKIRMEERLTYQIQCPEDLCFCLVPPLLIEPIVENAVIHGIAPKKEGGKILITVTNQTVNQIQSLFITVEDNGLGIKGNDFSGGFGIFSVSERLKLLYGERARFTVTPLTEGGTRVLLEVPCDHSDH